MGNKNGRSSKGGSNGQSNSYGNSTGNDGGGNSISDHMTRRGSASLHLSSHEPNPWIVDTHISRSPHTYPPGTQLPKDFMQGNAKQKPFHKWEREMLKTTFLDLASRSATGKTIDKETFLKFFANVPGMLGERLFYVFNRSGSGALDLDEFIQGLAAYSRGSMEQKVSFIFRMCNLGNNGRISKAELETMCNSFVFAAESVFARQSAERHIVPTLPRQGSTAGVGATNSNVNGSLAIPATGAHASHPTPPTPNAEQLHEHLKLMRSRAHSPSFAYSPSLDEDSLHPSLRNGLDRGAQDERDGEWTNGAEPASIVDNHDPSRPRVGSAIPSTASAAAAATTAGVHGYLAAAPSAANGSPGTAHLDEDGESEFNPSSLPQGLLHRSHTLHVHSSSKHDPTQDLMHSSRVREMVEDAFSSVVDPVPAPPTSVPSSDTTASSPPSQPPAGLTMYHFGRWLLNHPEILEVLDQAFVGKEGLAYLDGGNREQAEQLAGGAPIAVANGSTQPTIAGQHRASFLLSSTSTGTGTPGLIAAGRNSPALLSHGVSVRRASLNGLPDLSIDARDAQRTFTVPALLTPQHPASALTLSGHVGNGTGPGNSPACGPLDSASLADSSQVTLPPASITAHSHASSTTNKHEEKATWKNGPRLSISSVPSSGVLGLVTSAGGSVGSGQQPSSTRAASTSLVGSRFSSHTHALPPSGAEFANLAIASAVNSGAVNKLATHSSAPLLPLPPPLAFSFQCQECNHSLTLKHCVGCGHLLTCHSVTIPTTHGIGTTAATTAATMPGGSTSSAAAQGSPATSAVATSSSPAVAPANTAIEYLCSHCPLAPFGPSISTPRFCPSCGCESATWKSLHAHQQHQLQLHQQAQSKSLLASYPSARGSISGLPHIVPAPQQNNTLTSSSIAVPRGQASIEGYLKKVGARLKNIMSRWYVIRDNFMYTYTRPGDFKPAHVLFLEGCFVEAVNHEDRSSKLKYGIEIILSDEPVRKSRVVYASSHESRQQWLDSIRVHANVHDIEDYYTFGKELGVGRFSSVREGLSKTSGKKYAIKIIDKSEVNEAEREALRTEVAVLKLVHHPSIIRLKNVFETRKQIFIVMSFVKGGDLFDRLVKRKRFSEATTQVLMLQLLQVVQYLHVRGIVHRDLKPENILMRSSDDDTQIMLADFGLGAFALPDQGMKTACGTLTFTAPEVLTGKGYGMAVDLWSVGVILYMLIRGSLPFDGKNSDEIREKTIHGRYQLDGSHTIWKEVSQECKDLIKGLLTVDSTARLTCQQALEHPFFKLKFPSSASGAAATTVVPAVPAASMQVPQANGNSAVPSIPRDLSPDGDTERLPGVGAGVLTLPESIQTIGDSTHAVDSGFASLSATPVPYTIAAPSPVIASVGDGASRVTPTPTPSIYASMPLTHTYDSSAFSSLSSSLPGSHANSLTSSLVLPTPPPNGTSDAPPPDASPPPTLTDFTRLSQTNLPSTRSNHSRGDSNDTVLHAPIPIDTEPSQLHDSPNSVLSPITILQYPHSSLDGGLMSPSPVAAAYLSPQPHLVLPHSPNSLSSQLVNRRDSDDEEEERTMDRRFRTPQE